MMFGPWRFSEMRFSASLFMFNEARPTKVLLYQSVGFLAIIALCMLDELIGLSSLLLGNQTYISDFRQSILKVLLIFGVWLIVAGSTRRVLAHMKYLEEFMKVCAWCRRIEYKGRWMPLEEFFEQGFDTPTSHGICHDCLDKTKSALQASRQARNEELDQHSAPKELKG